METPDKKPDGLDSLASQAASLTNPPLGQGTTDLDTTVPPGQQTTPALTNAQALCGAIAAAREAFCFYTKLQSPRVVLVDEQVQNLAALWAPVLDKHGINLSKYMGDYALEMTAIVGTLTIASSLRIAVSAELAQLREDKPAVEASQPGASDDAPGAQQ